MHDAQPVMGESSGERLQVRWRGADAQILNPEASRHERCTVAQFADAHGEIDVLFRQIHRPVREGDVDLKLKVLACEPEQYRRDAMVAERERHADPHAASPLAVPALEFGLGGFEFGKRPDASIVIGLPGLRERLRARRPMQQARAEPGLKLGNHFADRRARKVLALGDERRASGFGHRNEGVRPPTV